VDSRYLFWGLFRVMLVDRVQVMRELEAGVELPPKGKMAV
jgi:hypothetical protein